MELISEERVDDTWQEVAGFTPSRGSDEMIKLGRQQPDLLAFMMELSEDLEPQIKELAIYMFFVVYRIFEKNYPKKIQRLKAKEIIKCYDDNEKLMENLEQAHERFFERIAKIQISAQPYVIKYIVDTLYEAPQEEDPIDLDEEDTGYLFLLLKTVVDTLNNKTDLT